MKIKVKHKKNYGVEMFYPADDWTTTFISVFKGASQKSRCLSRRQIDLLKSLGFVIESVAETI